MPLLHSDELNNKLTQFQKSMTLEMDCPMLSYVLLHNVHGLRTTQDKKLTLAEIFLDYGWLTNAGTVESSEIQKNVDLFKNAFAEKSATAMSQNKKLLVVMGEMHSYQQSIFYELAITTFLKNHGFDSMLIEADRKGLNKVHQDKYKIYSSFKWSFAEDVLDIKLIPVDPLNKIGGLSTARCNAINDAIANNANSNQIAIVGEKHLKHILSSAEINTKFTILSVALALTIDKYPPNILEKYDIDFTIPHSTLRLGFSDLIESFSIGKLLSIYQDSLPYFLEQEEKLAENDYYSDFSKNYNQCHAFDNIPDLVAGMKVVAEQYYDL
jgi:hypothetical protein